MPGYMRSTTLAAAEQSRGDSTTPLSPPTNSLPPHERYQFKPFTGSSHSWALEILRSLPPTAAVLDIGCGSGAIGRALRESGFSALDAIEIDAEARQAVRPIYRRLEASLDPYLAPTSQAASAVRYDAILLLDVIEHMAEPEAFLERCLSLLAPGGIFLISVPNITHWSVRLPMLFGHFEYTERGILDRTHLQFFTTERVRRLSTRIPGLELVRHEGSIAPAEFVLPRWISNSSWFEGIRRIRRFGAEIWPSLFAFQHVALFRRRKD